MQIKKDNGIDRREFLKCLGAGTIVTTTALAGCKSVGAAAGSAAGEVPTDKMTYRINQNTDDKVSILGYGCMRWPTRKGADGRDEIDQETVNELVDYALAHGVNYFDTSPVYVQGKSETATGIALSRHPRDSYFLATKMSNFSNWSRENSIAMYERSLRELKTDYFDYYLLHSVGGSIEDFNRRYIDNGMLDFMIEERKAGRIRNLGWSFHGDAGGGYSRQPDGMVWDGEIFAMAVMPSFQNITTFRTNNTGENLSSSATDFFAGRRQTGLSRYVGVGLPGVPSLSDKRTLFNRSFMVSTNNLWKFGRGEFKANIDYSFNRVTADASNITTYFLASAGTEGGNPDFGNRVITENSSGKDRTHSLGGKFIYELNQKTAFINNTLQTNIDWDDVGLAVTGSIPSSQSARLPDYYVANRFKMIKRFNRSGKTHLVTFQSNNEWESMPQTLDVGTGDGAFRQHVSDHAFYTHESAAYAFNIKGITVSLEGGLKGYLRSMRSQLPDLPQELPGLTENVVNTNYVTVYAVPRLEYWVRRVNLSLDLPLSYAHYAFDKAIADRDEVYFSPSMSLNWKPNNRFSGTLRGGMGRSPMNLNLIHPGLVMTDYRTLKAGTEQFYNSSSQNVSASINYRHTRHGLFANAMAMQSWTHVPYTMAQQLYGDYVVYSYADARNDSRMLMALGNIGKTLDFMRGSCNVNGSFTRNESQLLSLSGNDNPTARSRFVSSVSSVWSIGGKISGNPWWWLGFDYSINYSDSQLAMNGLGESWLSTLRNQLSIIITPHRKWQWTVSAEHYRNELTAHNFKNVLMLDTGISFRLNKRIELASSLTNILNRRSYNYTAYSELSSFESRRQLRGRQFLLSVTLRK